MKITILLIPLFVGLALASTLEKLEKAYAEGSTAGLQAALKETKTNDLVACYQDLRPTEKIVRLFFLNCQDIY